MLRSAGHADSVIQDADVNHRDAEYEVHDQPGGQKPDQPRKGFCQSGHAAAGFIMKQPAQSIQLFGHRP